MNVHDLNYTRDKQIISRINYYERIYQRCFRRMKVASRSRHTSCFYVVPEFMWGTPLYNVENCCKYVIYKLRRDNIYVWRLYKNLLLISWEHVPSKLQLEYKQALRQQNSTLMYKH